MYEQRDRWWEGPWPWLAYLPCYALPWLWRAPDARQVTWLVVAMAVFLASVAFVVEDILDIVDGGAAVRSDIDDTGLLGSAVLGDRVTELLDVRAAILAADPAFYAGTPAPSPASALLEV